MRVAAGKDEDPDNYEAMQSADRKGGGGARTNAVSSRISLSLQPSDSNSSLRRPAAKPAK